MSGRELYRESAERGGEVFQNEFLPPHIGRLSPPGPSGEIFVEVKGRTSAARLLSGVSRTELLKEKNTGREVLLIFEAGDSDRPIIVGLMENRLDHLVSTEAAHPAPELKEILVDGKRVTIEAEEEVVLRCGAGSITLKKDGKIVIKGTHLLSRSSGPIRVKGARVDIN